MSRLDLFGLNYQQQQEALAQEARQTRNIESKIDLLLTFLQITTSDSPALPPDIDASLAEDHKIEAICLYRERFAVGLKEAKEAVDAAEHGPARFARIERKIDAILNDLGIVVLQTDASTLAGVEAEIRRGNKIAAIKLYRELRQSGLKEAKDAVEEMERRLHEP